jgi:hypothetical protein
VRCRFGILLLLAFYRREWKLSVMTFGVFFFFKTELSFGIAFRPWPPLDTLGVYIGGLRGRG